jgi:hypothetical protein
MLYVVNGRSFLLDSSGSFDHPRIMLYQSDITTLVSLALVIVRLLAAAWFSLTAWRTMFIILEKRGMKWNDVKWILGTGVPHFPFEYNRRKRTIRLLPSGKRLSIIAWVIFSLALPAQLVAPLAAGSLTWIPVTETTYSGLDVAITTAGESKWWDYFNTQSPYRLYTVYRAAALASIFPVSSFNRSAPPVFRRQIPSIRGLSPNSTLASVLVPRFEIHSLQWVTNQSEIDEINAPNTNVWDDLTIGAQFSGTLNISSNDNPLFSFQDGTLAIMNDEPWTEAPATKDGSAFPAAAMVSDTRLVVVLFNLNNGAHEFKTCPNATSLAFGYPPSELTLLRVDDQDSLSMPTGPEPRSCWAVARLNFTAGVAVCTDCPVVSDSVVEASPSPSQPLITMAHPLVHTAIHMMPEVLKYMSIMNISLVPTWNNLDGYTFGMLSVAYQASWNSVNNDCQTSSPGQTTAKAAFQVLNARVSKWRMLTWFGLNHLLTISGVLLAVLQSACAGKTVRNPALAALMLDTKAVLESDTSGFCNALELNKKDAHRRIKLVVSSEKSATYHHPRLVLDIRDSEEVYMRLEDFTGEPGSAGASRETFEDMEEISPL